MVRFSVDVLANASKETPAHETMVRTAASPSSPAASAWTMSPSTKYSLPAPPRAATATSPEKWSKRPEHLFAVWRNGAGWR